MFHRARSTIFSACVLDWVHVQLHRAAMLLSAVLIPAAEGGYIALNPETATTTQGEDVSEALTNLREATELYLEEFPLSSAG